MLTEATFGQYLPADSRIHRLDPRLKLLALIYTIVMIFVGSNRYGLAFSLFFVVLTMVFSKIPLRMYLRNLKVVLPILVFTGLINMFYVSGADVIAHFWIFTLTKQGIYRAVFMATRVCLLILISAVLTYTTTPNDLTDAIEQLCMPLKHIGLGSAVHTLTMMMTIALRFIPTLIEETGRIMNAQKARGADLETGGVVKRVKVLIPILVPLLILSIRSAYELADAMECRCYNGGIGKQRMKQLRFSLCDLAAAVILILYGSGVITLNLVF